VTPPAADTATATALHVEALRERAYPLPGDPSRLVVPEPVVKATLAALGVRVPASATGADPATVAAASSALTPPLVLKAFGGGVVHKSDIGAVQLGLVAAHVEAAAHTMATRLASHGLAAAGFLVEEQQPPGVELLVGVVRRAPFPPLVLVGLGGTYTEVLDEVVPRLHPLARADAEAMLDGFRGAAVLGGARGRAPVDRDALVALLLAIAGEGGLVDQLGPWFAELECNPVIASADGVVAADARLVLHRDVPPPVDTPAHTDFTALFAPRSVAIAGASTTRPGFGNRFLAGYRDFGWTDGLYAIHPQASEVDGVPAFPSVADVPGGVDYFLVAVPAAACPAVVEQASGHARFVHVISGGFGETGAGGTRLEDELRASARAAGVRVLGPNCMGVYAPGGRQTFMLDSPREVGHVSVISQSGGLAGDIVKAGNERGLRYSKLVTVGNAIDVAPGELLEAFVDDADTKVVGMYLEGTRDAERLVAALRAAAGRKPVALLVGGLSRQGAHAVASHTGSLAGDHRVWEAVSAATGATVTTTLEDFLAVLVYLQRYADHPGTGDGAVVVMGPGGGASVLATDACDRAGLEVAAVRDGLQAMLRGMGFGAGTSVANPIEVGIGPVAPDDQFTRVLGPVLAEQPYPDALLHVNVHTYFSYGTTGVAPLLETIAVLGRTAWPATRVALALRNLDCVPPADVAALRAASIAEGIPTYSSFDEAATAIAAAKRFARAR